MAESDIIVFVVIPCSAKFDKLGFVGSSKPEFRVFVEALDNVVHIRQKSRIPKVIYRGLSHYKYLEECRTHSLRMIAHAT